MTRMATRLFWWTTAVLSVGIALFSYRYLPGIGPRGQQILANLFARPFLAIHVAGAATALLIGAFQFVPALRKRVGMHRWMGRVYAAGCIGGGIGGFVLAFGSTAGIAATIGFGTLAPIWIFTTAQGWRTAIQRRFDEHRAWMIRSWALTLAAVTLRLYLPILPLFGLSFVDGYRLTAFISWIPNLIVAELYLRGWFTRRPAPTLAVA